MLDPKGPWLDLRPPRKDSGVSPARKILFFVSIPKKIEPLATRRNRLKRLIRESMRRIGRSKEIRDGLFLRVLRIPEPLNLDRVENDLHEALKNKGLL